MNYTNRTIRQINKRNKAELKTAMYILGSLCAVLIVLAGIAKLSGL